LEEPARTTAIEAVGRPGSIALRTQLGLAVNGAAWVASLGEWLDTASDSDDAIDAVDAWADEIGNDQALSDSVYQSTFQAALGGQLWVLEHEAVDEPAPRVRANEAAFLDMPFDEAVAFFRSKGLMTEAEFDALRDRYREGGFIARRLASERLQELARASLARLLDQGMTLREIRAVLGNAESVEAQALGITPAAPHYIETIIRTNVATAYGAGRWEAMNSPAVAKLRPFLQYRCAGDSRVRPNHRALHGLVFPQGSDVAAYYAPPLGFRCRCTMVTLSARQVEARGLTVTDSRIPNVDPDPGWEVAPAPLSSADL